MNTLYVQQGVKLHSLIHCAHKQKIVTIEVNLTCDRVQLSTLEKLKEGFSLYIIHV